ncbi:MAG TPA: TRAP transporter small permease [Geminicoccaceae bacterium]|nr:TRAP transporter small permease [Geminicoccus sp.]HMU49123.1 TRAP transporter small permease [Geminicoccaceae bacterium]
MQSVLDKGFKLLELLIVLLLVGMVGMVFGNVVLRYGFDSGIDVSEELSRYFFVWLTFIGAVVVHREHAHLGVDAMVKAMPQLGRRACMAITDALILICCIVFFWGTWQQAGINATNYAPITGLPMIFVYGIGFFTSIAMAAITGARLLALLTGRIDPKEVAMFAGDIEDEAAHEIKGLLE